MDSSVIVCVQKIGPSHDGKMIPLLVDPFFGAMAVCIIFGLSFAAFLSLIVTPVLYAIFYGVHEGSVEPVEVQ